jgi:BirA family biotin operon repressor/biotin-[acetyl-CoA-carboxylase] ligase
MINSTHPEFEDLASKGESPSSGPLRQYLDRLGVGFSLQGKTIFLDPSLELLAPDIVRRHLQAETAGGKEIAIEIHRTTQSTNDVALARLSDPAIDSILCSAEMQTAGKGRRGRQWVSPFGRNIYMSYGCFVRRELSELSGLSLIAGMQVVDTLRKLGLSDVGLKWPNDILLEDGKLAGILVELKPAEKRGIGVVVGVGINLALDEKDALQIDQPWSAISSRVKISRNQLLGMLAGRLVCAIEIFAQQGFSPFARKWDEYNVYAGKKITIIRGDETTTGIDAGVDLDGNLRLNTGNGIVIHNSGEVSMRPAT